MQVRAVTFGNCLSPEYCKAVVAGLGAQLRSVKWQSHIDLSVLAPCTGLEELEINSLFKITSMPILNGEFLPNLRKLSSNQCLNEFGPTFETFRPSLTEVRLHCAHFGCDQQVSGCNWEDLPQLWPNLEHFTLMQYNEDLTSSKASQIFPQLKKLKSLSLSIEKKYDRLERDGVEYQGVAGEEARDRLVAQFWDLPSPIRLQFKDFYHFPCNFLKNMLKVRNRQIALF